MWFISSVVAVGAVAMYDRLEDVSEEAAIACVAIALTSIVIFLISAPWQVHLVVVVGVLMVRARMFTQWSLLGDMGRGLTWLKSSSGLSRWFR